MKNTDTFKTNRRSIHLISRFIQVSRQQQYLLPPLIDEWLLDNHLARFIAEVIDQVGVNPLNNKKGY